MKTLLLSTSKISSSNISTKMSLTEAERYSSHTLFKKWTATEHLEIASDMYPELWGQRAGEEVYENCQPICAGRVDFKSGKTGHMLLRIKPSEKKVWQLPINHRKRDPFGDQNKDILLITFLQLD